MSCFYQLRHLGKLSLRADPDEKHGHCKCLNRPAEPVAPVRAVVIAFATAGRLHRRAAQVRTAPPDKSPKAPRHRRWRDAAREIGRASCVDRGCQFVYTSVVAVASKKN